MHSGCKSGRHPFICAKDSRFVRADALAMSAIDLMLCFTSTRGARRFFNSCRASNMCTCSSKLASGLASEAPNLKDAARRVCGDLSSGRGGSHARVLMALPRIVEASEVCKFLADTRVCKDAEEVVIIMDTPMVCTDTNGVPYCVPGGRARSKNNNLLLQASHGRWYHRRHCQCCGYSMCSRVGIFPRVGAAWLNKACLLQGANCWFHLLRAPLSVNVGIQSCSK
jgi:hypothetical protein